MGATALHGVGSSSSSKQPAAVAAHGGADPAAAIEATHASPADRASPAAQYASVHAARHATRTWSSTGSRYVVVDESSGAADVPAASDDGPAEHATSAAPHAATKERTESVEEE